MNQPYSHEDLAALKKQLEEDLYGFERQYPEVRPLPPMGEDEAKDLLIGLMQIAATRMLTENESFFCGQLLAAHRMAVEARMLGRRGRYYVISMEEFDRLAGKRFKAPAGG